MGEDRYSGVLKIVLTARTPLLIGGFVNESGEADLPRRARDGRPIVPGSGLMGAIRSLHEAMAGGCLRILDRDWVPVHRHPANVAETSKAGLRLAVVTDVDQAGVPKAVKLCDEWIWIPGKLLPSDGERLSRTGDKLGYRENGTSKRLPQAALDGTKDRRILRVKGVKFPQGAQPGSIVRVGEMGTITGESWILLVTDTQARHAAEPYFAAGRIGPDAPSHEIPDTTWKHYLDVVDGADDLRPESLDKSKGNGSKGKEPPRQADDLPPESLGGGNGNGSIENGSKGGADRGKEPPWDAAGPAYADVFWPPHEGDRGRVAIAQRLPARRYLYEGQPVWVRVDRDAGIVTEIRLSELWRYRGDGPVGERVGDAQPCTDSKALCWSCRVFGSADTEGREPGGLAEQHSYRGHIRIDDLVAKGDVEPLNWHLAPLSAPRPSAGQFYLDNTGRQRVTAKDTKAAATWGSDADKPGPRQIRGRKFYWRTKEPEKGPVPRGQYREHQSEAMSKKVALFPAGTVFEGRVCFDNLGIEDYGSLLAALDPRLMAGTEPGWTEVVGNLGGGKPFGFGAVTIDVEPELVQTARARYLGEDAGQPGTTEPESVQTARTRHLGEDAEQPGMTDAILAFRAKVPDDVRQTWRALEHALTFGFVADELVWYPPGGPEGTAKGAEEFDWSFEFFARTAGIELRDEKRQLVSLPEADGPPAAQVLDSLGDVRPNSGGRSNDGGRSKSGGGRPDGGGRSNDDGGGRSKSRRSDGGGRRGRS
jgi:CRISPR-associated protein (TIGR03986 family)